MLGIDIALLVGGGIALVALAGWLGGRLGPRAEARRQRLLGERNAEAERQRLAQLCGACGEPTDPTQDVLEDGRWWHRTCYRELLQ